MPYEIEAIEHTPYFDLETFMILTQSPRVERATVETVEEYLEKWQDKLQVRGITIGEKKYLLVWMDKTVEDEVNTLWESSPSKAFTANSLAQSLCMALIRDLIPEIAERGCAPVPRPHRDLKAALKEVGMTWEEGATLSRQFAMLTPYPYQGGCAICHIHADCPNAKAD